MEWCELDSTGCDCFIPRETAPSTHGIRGWVSLRAGLHILEKSLYLVTFMTRTPDHPASIPVTISLSFPRLCLNCLLFNLCIYLSFRTQVHNLKIHNPMKIKLLTVYIPNLVETHTICINKFVLELKKVFVCNISEPTE
jgi:hypothetical protein